MSELRRTTMAPRTHASGITSDVSVSVRGRAKGAELGSPVGKVEGTGRTPHCCIWRSASWRARVLAVLESAEPPKPVLMP